VAIRSRQISEDGGRGHLAVLAQPLPVRTRRYRKSGGVSPRRPRLASRDRVRAETDASPSTGERMVNHPFEWMGAIRDALKGAGIKMVPPDYPG
jgi:hypothetical protein